MSFSTSKYSMIRLARLAREQPPELPLPRRHLRLTQVVHLTRAQANPQMTLAPNLV
jgi:hypothetical protein